MNGTFAYFVDIAGETEGYWCGIQHKYDETLIQQVHQKDFVRYGDEAEWREKYL